MTLSSVKLRQLGPFEGNTQCSHVRSQREFHQRFGFKDSHLISNESGTVWVYLCELCFERVTRDEAPLYLGQEGGVYIPSEEKVG